MFVTRKSHVCVLYLRKDTIKLSNFAKLFESILSNIVYSHVEKYIAIEQHGFVKGRSTLTNLPEFTHFVSESLDNKVQVDVIYTDMSKAFDMVNHCILLHKLRNFGICRNLVLMFQ